MDGQIKRFTRYPMIHHYDNESDYEEDMKKYNEFLFEFWSGNISVCNAEFDAINDSFRRLDDRYSKTLEKMGNGFECLDHICDYETYYKEE